MRHSRVSRHSCATFSKSQEPLTSDFTAHSKNASRNTLEGVLEVPKIRPTRCRRIDAFSSPDTPYSLVGRFIPLFALLEPVLEGLTQKFQESSMRRAALFYWVTGKTKTPAQKSISNVNLRPIIALPTTCIIEISPFEYFLRCLQKHNHLENGCKDKHGTPHRIFVESLGLYFIPEMHKVPVFMKYEVRALTAGVAVRTN